MGREKLVIIPTGGTIMSAETSEGIKPGLDLLKLLHRHAPYVLDNFNIRQTVPFPQKDSTLIDTKDWTKIAKTAYRASTEDNNVLILHGTDTISYTAAAISFAVIKPQTSIVIVGSMRIPEHPETDVSKNLRDAGIFLSENMPGVYMVFNGKVMVASRVIKIKSIDEDANAVLRLLHRGEPAKAVDKYVNHSRFTFRRYSS